MHALECSCTNKASPLDPPAGRFVRTRWYEAEEAAGEVLYRNTFGTQRGGMGSSDVWRKFDGVRRNIGDLELKNVANTNAVWWGGKLLVLWEAGECWKPCS